MATITTPGVYVLENDPGPRPIEAHGTNIAAFVGEAPAHDDQRVGRVTPVTSWSDFRRKFVDLGAPDDAAPASTDLARGVAGFFQNGGGLAMVVDLGANAGQLELDAALGALAARDEVSIVAAPGLTGPAAWEALIGHCEALGDRVAILDAIGIAPDTEVLTRAAMAAPASSSTSSSTSSDPGDDETDTGTDDSGADEDDDDDDPSGSMSSGSSAGQPPGERPRESSRAIFYYPRIQVTDPIDGTATITPPSGHLAGVFARVDDRRGVHKAPANEPIIGALSLEAFVTKAEQGPLNIAGVNVIRSFPRQGIRIWGARTLEPSGPYRYINVRRLVDMLKEAIEDGCMWAVFEPNDNKLWRSIDRDVTAFLTRVWRDGALLGRTPDEAFYVRCDRETNPDEEIDAGRVTTEIGIAPVKPAEFVVFKISMSASAETNEGE
jgi:uncharacterized protein